jgi:hypothetical protein
VAPDTGIAQDCQSVRPAPAGVTIPCLLEWLRRIQRENDQLLADGAVGPTAQCQFCEPFTSRHAAGGAPALRERFAQFGKFQALSAGDPLEPGGSVHLGRAD